LSREEEKQNAARFVGLLLTLAGLIYFWLGTVRHYPGCRLSGHCGHTDLVGPNPFDPISLR